MTKNRENFIFISISNIITALTVYLLFWSTDNIVDNTSETMAMPVAIYSPNNIFLCLVVLFNILLFWLLYNKNHKPDVQRLYQVNSTSTNVVQMKEYYHLENLRRAEEVSLEVKNYAIRTMAPYMTVPNIEFLCANIEGWTKSKAITLKPLDVSTVLSSLDLRHFAWNIGERLGWSGQQRAQFIKQTFPNTLQDLEVETIRRNLRQKGTCLIKIDVPEHGDFHFQKL